MNGDKTLAGAGLRLLVLAVVVVSVMLPLVLAAMYSRGAAPFLLATYTMRFQPWETFGAVVSLVALAAVVPTILVRRRAGISIVGPLVALAVALHLLTVLVDYAEFSVESPVWQRHLGATEAVARGPSAHGLPSYGELPSVASLDVGFVGLTRLAWRIGGPEPKPNEIANGVHYLWQCCQFLAVMGAFLLLSRLWQQKAGADVVGWLMAGGLVVLCFPLLRALRHDPVAPLMLLVGTAVVAHRSLRGGHWVAGLSTALAFYLSGYGALLILPFLVYRRWSVVWRFMVCIGVLLLPWAFRGTLGLWSDGLRGLWHRAVIVPPLDAGLQGTVRHILFRLDAGGGTPLLVGAIDCMLLAVGAWWILRRRRHSGTFAGADQGTRCKVALAGVLALLAMLVPTPWGSEYVLVLPLALLALQLGRGRPGLLIAGVLLTVLLPGMDIFLLRCHRFVGVALLLWAIIPREPQPLPRDFRSIG